MTGVLGLAGSGISTLAVVLVALGGPATSAVNPTDGASSCDQAALNTAVASAATNEIDARRAYTTYARDSQKAQSAEATVNRAARGHGPTAKKHHKAASVGKQGRIKRARLARAVQAQRAHLKEAWDSAKHTLAAAKTAAAGCKSSAHGSQHAQDPAA
jgi:hypothetical protein